MGRIATFMRLASGTADTEDRALRFLERSWDRYNSEEFELWIGVRHAQFNRLADAERWLSRAVERAPGYALALVIRAAVRRRLRDFNGALADCDRAIALHSTSPLAHYNRGTVHLSDKRHDLAE
ncbi:MAG: tetratricopeptide repeat protein, partial [Planctomycetota bacterium]